MATIQLPSQNAEVAEDEARWQAVLARDPAADDRFVFSVRTTGIYCRPSCPARRPRRENVRLHDSCAAAERAGSRACRRCRPNDAPLAERQREAVVRSCRTIEAAEKPPSLDELATAVGMSRFHFQRTFKAVTGMTPRAYAAGARAERVRKELPRAGRVADAIYAAGFESSGRFYAAARAELGMTPAAYRAGGAGELLRYAIGDSTLGSVLVAASARGICAILLGDDSEVLASDLARRLPRAELVPGNETFGEWVAKCIALVEHPARGIDLPLDIRGTAFQRRVWQALAQIPPGDTASYAELAARLGQPQAARAVAAACAANPLAVAVPCHRVVRSDSSLAGYRWGLERKAELLRRESTELGH